MTKSIDIAVVALMVFLWILPNSAFADPAQHETAAPSDVAETAAVQPAAPLKTDNPSSKEVQKSQENASPPATDAENASLPKGFDASADRVWQEIQENIPPIMESCGNAGLSTLGMDLYYDAKGNIFKIGFGYIVKNGVGTLAGSPELNEEDVVSIKQCIANQLSKVKFNIDVTGDIIELFSSKDKKVLSTAWYGTFSFGYRYDEHRFVGVTSFAIGRPDRSAKFWKCRKHGCNTPYRDRPFLSNKEIEALKQEIVELMGKLPVDSKTMMYPGILGIENTNLP